MNKDIRYTIRFTSKEWEGINARAVDKDMKLSEYIRSMIDKGEIADYKDRHNDSDKFDW